MEFVDNHQRKQVIGQALDARTLPELAAATQAVREWVHLHPADVGITEVFEGLSLMGDIAEEQEAEHPRSKQDDSALTGAGRKA